MTKKTIDFVWCVIQRIASASPNFNKRLAWVCAIIGAICGLEYAAVLFHILTSPVFKEMADVAKYGASLFGGAALSALTGTKDVSLMSHDSVAAVKDHLKGQQQLQDLHDQIAADAAEEFVKSKG